LALSLPSLSIVFLCCFISSSAHPPALHSFPTRRSSDLRDPRGLQVFERSVPEQIRETRAPDTEKQNADHTAWRQEPIIPPTGGRSEEHTSELQSRVDLVCRLLLEKKK